jgi:hypothetical protein
LNVPTRTGGDASGTWGINITGNAATATSATDSTKLPLSGGTMTGTITNSASSLVIGTSGGATRGYLYNDSSGFGLLTYTGGWAARVPYGTADLEVSGNNRGASLGLNGGFRITDPGSGYGYFNNWVGLGTTGFYSSTNSAHIYPNTGSYGAWMVTGTRNGWGGMEFSGLEGGNLSLMMNPTQTGIHNNSYGWHILWSTGTLYIYKGSSGGGTQAVALDSTNWSSYVSAPAPTTAQVLSATAGGTGDAVGTYAMLRELGSATYNVGTTRPGSTLRYSNAGGEGSSTANGTWRCMGYVRAPGNSITTPTSIFLRIS